MTVQELINKLQDVEDKSKEVLYLDREDFSHDIYEVLDCDKKVYFE